MEKIDYKILQFLVDGKAYSDTAIIKNLGITLVELNEAYSRLTKDGYLESYSDYLARTNSQKDDENEIGCGSHCGHDCSSCDNNIPEEYYHNIRVLTLKAINLF